MSSAKPGSIESFKAMTKASFARPTKFSVEIHQPTSLLSGVGNRSELDRVHMNCKSVSIPEKSIGVTEVDQGFRAFAKELLFENQFSVGIYLSSDMMELKFFQRWLDHIVKPHNHHIQYYKNYIGTFKIISLDTYSEKSMETTFYDAYPKAIGNIDYDYATVNEILEIEVTINYRYYEQAWFEGGVVIPQQKPQPEYTYGTNLKQVHKNESDEDFAARFLSGSSGD